MKFIEAIATDEKEEYEITVDNKHNNIKHILKMKPRDTINHNNKKKGLG